MATHGFSLPHDVAHLAIVAAHGACVVGQQRIVRKPLVVFWAMDQHGIHHLRTVQGGPVYPHDWLSTGTKLMTTQDIEMENIRTQHSTAIGARLVFRIEQLKNESSCEPPYLLSVSIQHVSEWEGEAERAQPGPLGEGCGLGELLQKAGLALALLLCPVWVGVLQQPPLS